MTSLPHPSKRWKYIEAVFVPPGKPHPQWCLPIGKQLVGEHRSTPGFLVILRAIRKRQWEDQSVNGTYSWQDGGWRLVSETTIVDLDLSCPASLPADIDVVGTESDDDSE